MPPACCCWAFRSCVSYILRKNSPSSIRPFAPAAAACPATEPTCPAAFANFPMVASVPPVAAAPPAVPAPPAPAAPAPPTAPAVPAPTAAPAPPDAHTIPNPHSTPRPPRGPTSRPPATPREAASRTGPAQCPTERNLNPGFRLAPDALVFRHAGLPARPIEIDIAAQLLLHGRSDRGRQSFARERVVRLLEFRMLLEVLRMNEYV